MNNQMVDTIKADPENRDETEKKRPACYFLPFFLLSLPLTVGCMIALSSYDKYIQVSFPSAFLGGNNINFGLWAFASSLFPLGGIVGTFSSIYASNHFGERSTTFFSVFSGLLGSALYVICYFISSFTTFCVSRLIFGFSSGGIMAVGIVYMYDLIHPSKHRILSVTVQLLINIGLLVSGVFSIEAIVGDRWVLTVSPLFLLQVISVFILIGLPSSPAGVCKRTRCVEKTIGVLRKIRYARSIEIEQEANSIFDALIKNENREKVSLSSLFKQKKLRNPLLITSLCAIFQQFSGINIAIFYATDLVSKAGFSQLDLGNVILFGDCALGSAIFAFIIPFFGSRTMLILGHMMMSASYFFAFGLNMSSVVPPFVTVIMISQFLFWFQAGPGPKPWTIFSETFEPQYRESAQGLLSFCNWLSNFIITLIYPFIREVIGFYSILMFAIINFLFGVFFFGFMVETKNKTPEQIIDEYQTRKIRCCH